MLGGDELRHDADRDLLRRNSADVQTDWRVDALKRLRRRAFFDERIEDTTHLRFAPDETEIA